MQNILSGKLALRYAGREAEALKAIAQSAIKRSLAQFQQVCFNLFLKSKGIMSFNM